MGSYVALSALLQSDAYLDQMHLPHVVDAEFFVRLSLVATQNRDWVAGAKTRSSYLATWCAGEFVCALSEGLLGHREIVREKKSCLRFAWRDSLTSRRSESPPVLQSAATERI